MHTQQNNPLHISIFPSHDPATNTLKPIRTPLQFSLLLSSTLDIFDLRAKHSAVGGGGGGGGGGGAASSTGGSLSGDYGLLHAVDERLASYGYETNTGVKFVVVVDTRGRRIDSAALSGVTSSTSTAGNNNAPSTSDDSAAKGAGGFDGAAAARRGAAAVVGLREGDMKPVFRAMQTAYVRLLQNPFYEPDEHAPLTGHGGKRIVSRRFGADMRRIGEGWTVGVTSL